MPTAQLVFMLPEENSEFEITTSALPLYCVIHEFSEYLHRTLKHEEMDVTTRKAYEDIQKKLYEIIDDKEVKIEF